MKLLEANIGVNLHDPGLGNDLNMTTEVQAIKEMLKLCFPLIFLTRKGTCSKNVK